MSKKKTPTAIEVVREFYEDVTAAFGIGGKGFVIDEDAMDWPDLAETYKKACVVLREAWKRGEDA